MSVTLCQSASSSCERGRNASYHSCRRPCYRRHCGDSTPGHRIRPHPPRGAARPAAAAPCGGAVTYKLKASAWGGNRGAEGQVLGYRNGRAYWVNAGCYEPDTTYTVTVPWGNVGATPKVRARTPAGFGPLSINFQH